MTYVCIICGIEQPRALGRPVNDQKYPSWRCADAAACSARFLGRGRHRAAPRWDGPFYAREDGDG